MFPFLLKSMVMLSVLQESMAHYLPFVLRRGRPMLVLNMDKLLVRADEEIVHLLK